MESGGFLPGQKWRIFKWPSRLKRVVNRDCKETRQSCHADRQEGQHRLQAAMDAAICGGVSFHEGRGMCQNAAHTASQFGKDDHLSYVSVTYTETVEKVYHLVCPSRKPMPRFPRHPSTSSPLTLHPSALTPHASPFTFHPNAFPVPFSPPPRHARA